MPVDPHEAAKRALKWDAFSLVLVHNHPSGERAPSDADIDMTHQTKSACYALGLTLHDHLIILEVRELRLRADWYL